MSFFISFSSNCFFRCRIVRHKFWLIFFYLHVKSSITSILDSLICFFAKKLLLYRTITLNVNEAGMQKFDNSLFFVLFGFSLAGTDNSQDNRGKVKRGHPYFSLPLLSIYQYSDIYLQFLHLRFHLVFLIAAHAITTHALNW